MQIKVADIFVGERRRTDFGDIDALAKSIEELGLLHPVVVNGENKLIAGRRRLEAARRLKWTHIEATVAYNLDDALLELKAEQDENVCRKDFTRTEAVLMSEALNAIESQAARERMAKAGKIGGEKKGVEKFSDPSKGRAADKIAEAVGMSRVTLDKAKKVVDAAKADPENYGDLPRKMDEKGKVDPVFQEMVKRAEQFPIPNGPTPAQIAKNSAAVQWTKNIHHCWVTLNSIRDHGGLARLAQTWTPAEIANCISELRSFQDFAVKSIASLETLCLKKKSA